MRIQYTWTAKEWKQAAELAERRPGRASRVSLLTWAVVIIPVVGSAGDIVGKLRSSRGLSVAGSVLPELLLAFGVTAVLMLLMHQVRQRRHQDARAPMPEGACEALLQEGGWRIAPVDGRPAALMPWDAMYDARQSEHVFVLLRQGGFDAVPTRALSREQGGHLHRMLLRKLRPVV